MFREEKDSHGTVKVARDAYWGAQTQRSLENFKIGTEKMPWEVIEALAMIKRCAALVNREEGLLDPSFCDAIAGACDDILDRKLKDNFPLPVWQTGSGTQTNMNLNEVIANRANEILGFALGEKGPIHPNDHVNRSQSTNDTFSAAMNVAAVSLYVSKLAPALDDLAATLGDKERTFAKCLKIGRTHLQDAVPMTLGQEFSGYRAQILAATKGLDRSLAPLYDLAQGGTAVGTELNAPKNFGDNVAAQLTTLTRLPFRSAPNKFSAIASHDDLVCFSGALTALAAACMKIGNDLRWLASGPRCGIGEITLPTNEPGSSIMPGKVNPTQIEALTMICCQVMGNHTTVSMAGSMGNFELNVFKPVIIYAILQSIRLMADGIESFSTHCVRGITVNEEKLAAYLNQSLMMITALTPHIGYDEAARIAKVAHEEGLDLKTAILKSTTSLDPTLLESLLDPSTMIYGTPPDE